MIYDVRVFDKEGNLKKTVKGKKLIKDHWKNFQLKFYYQGNPLPSTHIEGNVESAGKVAKGGLQAKLDML